MSDEISHPTTPKKTDDTKPSRSIHQTSSAICVFWTRLQPLQEHRGLYKASAGRHWFLWAAGLTGAHHGPLATSTTFLQSPWLLCLSPVPLSVTLVTFTPPKSSNIITVCLGSPEVVQAMATEEELAREATRLLSVERLSFYRQ